MTRPTGRPLLPALALLLLAAAPALQARVLYRCERDGSTSWATARSQASSMRLALAAARKTVECTAGCGVPIRPLPGCAEAPGGGVTRKASTGVEPGRLRVL